jgi:hypothetical protein
LNLINTYFVCYDVFFAYTHVKIVLEVVSFTRGRVHKVISDVVELSKTPTPCP